MKTTLYTLLIITTTLLFSCKNSSDINEIKIEGLAQGTYYVITYYSDDTVDYQPQIDSFFRAFDHSASVYQPTSIISGFNRNDQNIFADDHFTTVFNKSMEVSANTNGAFDITVMPLVNAWGFGFTNASVMESAKVDSLLALVNYQNIHLENGRLIKKDQRMMIDFNAIAQGYSVDLIGQMLDKKGIHAYLIDVGGEVFAKGLKPDGSAWRVGIEKPAKEADADRKIEAVIELKDKALATSGNYRKFFMRNGIKYSHTIDPATGYPVMHSLLSVSVLANDCITADAYATAFMVMGLEKARMFLGTHPEMQAYFIYSDKEGKDAVWGTPGLMPLLEQEKPAQ